MYIYVNMPQGFQSSYIGLQSDHCGSRGTSMNDQMAPHSDVKENPQEILGQMLASLSGIS